MYKTMFENLFTYETLLDIGECYGFGNVTMLIDLGPLKAHCTYESIWFNVETGECCTYTGPEKEHSFKVKLVAA